MAAWRGKFAAAAVAAALCAAPAVAEEAKPPFKGRAEASYVQTSGNNDTQTFAGKAEAAYEPSANRYYGKAAFLYGKDGTRESANRALAEARYERALTDRFFVFLTGSALADRPGGYDARFTVGPGLGYEILKTDRHHLKTLLGILWAYDNLTDDTTDSYAMGKAEADYVWKISETVNFKEHATYEVSLEDANVSFLTSETALEVKVASNVSLGVGYNVYYQNDPPPGKKYTDTAFLTSLIVTF